MKSKLAALSMALMLTVASGAVAEELSVLTINQPGTPLSSIQADVIAAFEQRTGANVNLIEGGPASIEVFETSVIGGKQADVIIIGLNEGTLDWLSNGIVIPINNLIDKWGLRDRINANALKEWEGEDGQLSGFPYSGFVWPVWFNMDLLNKAGIAEPPKTIDELIADSAKLRAAGIAPFVVGGNDWSGQKLFLQIVQSYMGADEAREVFRSGDFCGSANAMKGIQTFVSLRDHGVFVDDVEGYTANQMSATFFEGQAAMMSAGSWDFTNAPATMNIALGGFPVPADGVYDKPTALEGWTANGFWISTNGEKKLDLVRQFISIWYEDAFASRVVAEADQPVAVNLSSAGNITNKLLAYASTDLNKNIEYAVMPDTWVPGSVANTLIRQISSTFAPGTSAEEVCAAVSSAYN